MRGFVQGVVWGSLAAVGGLVVVSQVAGPVAEPRLTEAAAPPAAEADPQAAPAAASAPEEAAGAAPEAREAEPEIAAAAPSALVDAPVGQDAAELAPAPAMPAPAEAAMTPTLAAPPVAPGADPVAEAAPAPVEPPAAPPSEAPGDVLASAGPVRQPVAPSAGDAPLAASQPAAPALPPAEGNPAPADLPPLPPLTPEEEALLQPLPEAGETQAEPEAVPADPTPEPGPLPEAGPEAVAEADPAPAPSPDVGDPAQSVVTGRLPRIGAEPPAAAEANAPLLPDVADAADLPPRLRYARPFENAAQKPLFAILLHDDGQEGVDRAELAALELPLSIVIDPLSEGGAERAAIWRAGGQEVVMAGTGIPVGAGPGDLEQSFQVLATRLPEAVAVIDADGNAFQNNRPLAAQVVPILAEQGRGLVTFDQGLNAADQVARREGLPAAVVFRSIDGGDETSPVVRRYLDRAAFKAAQEGRVIVIGTLRPETVAGVLEWAVEGRASTVALAPVSALLQD
ncbi:divergent polysaccharide deacetylase family protein [Pseudotabrizicola algicola]|uniref:divergent polysaccharide deacetylase family protein n=1 Tax=Pseudotabrizicola algicola TaxID=2709381 RepID=UPI00338E80C9